MTHINPNTGEAVLCKACEREADVFVSGLYPFCAEHGQEVVNLTKAANCDIFVAMKRIIALENVLEKLKNE